MEAYAHLRLPYLAPPIIELPQLAKFTRLPLLTLRRHFDVRESIRLR